MIKDALVHLIKSYVLPKGWTDNQGCPCALDQILSPSKGMDKRSRMLLYTWSVPKSNLRGGQMIKDAFVHLIKS